MTLATILLVLWFWGLLAWSLRRAETRGGHVRLDHLDRDDERWVVRQSVTLDTHGVAGVTERPADGQGLA